MPDELADGGEGHRLVDDVRATRLPKVSRIGIAVPARPERGGALPGCKAMAYDVDTGVLLPAQRIDLHLDAKEIVTATVVLIVDEVTVEGQKPGNPLAERVRSLATRDRTHG